MTRRFVGGIILLRIRGHARVFVGVDYFEDAHKLGLAVKLRSPRQRDLLKLMYAKGNVSLVGSDAVEPHACTQTHTHTRKHTNPHDRCGWCVRSMRRIFVCPRSDQCPRSNDKHDELVRGNSSSNTSTEPQSTTPLVLGGVIF